MINAAESWQLAANAGDKTAELKMRNQLIDCIIEAAKTREMKPSRAVEKLMRDGFSVRGRTLLNGFNAQDTAYLNKFARTSLANIADDYTVCTSMHPLGGAGYAGQGRLYCLCAEISGNSADMVPRTPTGNSKGQDLLCKCNDNAPSRGIMSRRLPPQQGAISSAAQRING